MSGVRSSSMRTGQMPMPRVGQKNLVCCLKTLRTQLAFPGRDVQQCRASRRTTQSHDSRRLRTDRCAASTGSDSRTRNTFAHGSRDEIAGAAEQNTLRELWISSQASVRARICSRRLQCFRPASRGFSPRRMESVRAITPSCNCAGSSCGQGYRIVMRVAVSSAERA